MEVFVMKSYVIEKIFLKLLVILFISLQVMVYCCALFPTPDDQILDLDSNDLYCISCCADDYCRATNQSKPNFYTVSFLSEMIEHYRKINDQQKLSDLFELAVRNYPLLSIPVELTQK